MTAAIRVIVIGLEDRPAADHMSVPVQWKGLRRHSKAFERKKCYRDHSPVMTRPERYRHSRCGKLGTNIDRFSSANGDGTD